MLVPATRRFSFLLLLALAGGPLACAPSDAEDVEAGDQEINAGQRTVMSRLTESVAPLRKVTATDETEVGRVFNKTLGETDINFSASTKLDLVGKVARNTLVALGKQTSTRKAMVRSSLAALTRRSDALKLVLRGKTATGPNVRPADFDEVVIGMGPQGTAYVQEAMREAVESGLPPRRILSIDIGDKPGGTFANVGDAFFLNSTNRADTGGRAQPGQGDLNFLYDLWGVRDFDPRTWPTAGGIGDVSTVGMDLSGAHALLKTELVSVERLPRTRNSASLRLTLRDLESGQQFTVDSRRLVGATGIGKPEIPIKDQGTLALVAEENAKKVASLKVDPDNAYVPKVQTFTDFINYVGQADEPYRWLVNKNVVVAGGGDSGNVINEFLLRIGPNGAYKFDSAQAGNIEKIYWLGVSFADCQQFIAQARGRYALLEAALNSGRLIPVPARLGAIARNGEGLRIRSSLPDAEFGTNAVDGVVYQDASGKFVTANPTIDYVILATGFKSDAYKVFKPLLGDVTPEQYAAQLTKIEADVAGFGADGSTQRVAIATQLKSKNGPEDIYFIGPANEVVGGLPSQAELARVNANTVSFFANVARTRTLARLNPPRPSQPRDSLDAIYDNVERIAVSRARTPRVRGEATVLPREGTTPARLSEIARIETRAELAKVLRGVDLPGDFQLTLSVTARGADELAITIPELAKTGEAEIVAQIRKSPRLMELFFGYFAKGSRVKELEIVIASDRSGRASWEIDVLPRLVVRE